MFEIYLFNTILKCISKCVAVTYHVSHLALFITHIMGIYRGAGSMHPLYFCSNRAPRQKRIHQIMWIDSENYNFFLCFSGGTSPADTPKSCQSSVLGTLKKILDLPLPNFMFIQFILSYVGHKLRFLIFLVQIEIEKKLKMSVRVSVYCCLWCIS